MATHTLLVADDSQTVQRTVELACAGEDVDVVTVADGDRAIARIVEHPPDIVLADIGMRGRNGYEVAAFVKGRADLAHIPVVLLAGMFEAADEARARALGCSEILVKPLKPHHVMARVRYWLESTSTPQPVQPDRIVVAVNEVGEAGASPTLETSGAGPVSAEDYFSRLDAAFKSLERPLGSRLGHTASAPSSGDITAGTGVVPTLQELLNRLPEETRTRLTPISASLGADNEQSGQGDRSVMDTIAARVLEHLATRGDLLDEIARLVALRRTPDDGR